MVCNFHGFLPKENIIYFSYRRDKKNNVELLGISGKSWGGGRF